MCGRTSLVCGYLTFLRVDHVKPSSYTTEIWFPLIHFYTHHLRTVHYITQYNYIVQENSARLLYTEASQVNILN